MHGETDEGVKYLDWGQEIERAWKSFNENGRFDYLWNLHERLFGKPMSNELFDYYLKASDDNFANLVNNNYRNYNNESIEERGKLAKLAAMDSVFETIIEMDRIYRTIINSEKIFC